MENLSLGKIFSILRQNARLILLFSITGMIIGVFYAFTVFKPVYKSTAKLLIKNNEQPNYVTELGTTGTISPLTKDGNPALTQMEIINSGQLAGRVWQAISAKYKYNDPPSVGVKLMQQAISVENPVGTDIIQITASWKNPQIARDIATGFANAYIAYNIDSSQRSIIQTQDAINKELAVAENNLAMTREKIKSFRQGNSTVNIDVESESVVTQLSDLENKYNELVASAYAERDKGKSIAAKLGLNWQTAMNSVALGHNPTITDLQRRLGEAQEELSSLGSKYAPTHPAMIALNSKINKITGEMKEQIKQTIGRETNGSLMISDPVRTTMMESLAESDATYRSLLAQSSVLGSAIGLLNMKKSAIPYKQQVLANLLQEEMNLVQLVNALKTKQMETGIRASGIVSNINMIDIPMPSLSPAFPAKPHIIVLFALFGMLIGMANVMIIYLTKDTFDEIDEIESEFKSPVFGVIPWLDKDTYNDPTSLFALDDTASYYSLAYQKVISSLRIRGHNLGIKAFAFTSTEFSKSRSTVLMNIAYGLNRAGRSVVVVDADFRTPSIHREFSIKVDENLNLGELLTNIASAGNEFEWNSLSYYLQQIPETSNLFVLPNIGNVADPNEFLYSSAFNLLIQKLKEQYDWVLLDTPPALAVSDAATVSSYVDGTILITGLETTKSALRKVYKLFNNHHLPIFGIIARQEQSTEAVSANEYIKQIISNMMPQEGDAFAEK